MNIKTPPMPNFPENSVGDNFLMACQDRDQQWIEMVRPLIYSAEKAEDLLRMFLSHQALTSDQFKNALRGLQAALSQIKGE